MPVAAAALNQHVQGLHRVPTPATEPPYDEPAQPVPPPPVPRRGTPVQGVLPLLFPRPTRRDVPRPRLRVVPDPPEPRSAAESPTESSIQSLPPLKEWAETAAMAIAQILTGERPPGPFRSAVVPEVYSLLSRKAVLAARGPRQRAVLRTVHVCCPARGIAEVATVVHGLVRPRALAFRLEARRTRWVCTALELG